jgi:hypothetical protein
MFRVGATLTVFLGLAAWAGAQGQPAPSAADQLQLLQANSGLIDALIDDSVRLAGANTAVDRAAVCQSTAQRLARKVETASQEENPDRVAEFGGHLERVVRDGLVPTLEDAKSVAPPESPEAKRVKEIRQNAIRDLGTLRDTLPTTGKVGDSEKVKKLRQDLDALRDALKDQSK